MTTDVPFSALVAPVRDLGVGDALEDWRWLVELNARPILLTALGDVFAELPTGEVAFLDTYEGKFGVVAAGRDSWKEALRQQSNLEAWFTPGLVATLHERGLSLSEGECYSPILPLVLSGTMEPANFHTVQWRVHLAVIGQIYEQSKDLPAGTPVTGFKVKQ